MTESKIAQARRLFIDGWRDSDIVRYLEVSPATFYRAKADWRSQEINILLDDFLEAGKRFYLHQQDLSPTPLFYDLAFAQRMCRDLNLIPRFTFRSFADVLPELDRGRYDLAIAFLSDHEDRRRYAEFTEPYMLRSLSDVLIGVRAGFDLRATDLQSWGPARIAVLRESLHHKFLRDKIPRATIRPYATKASCYNAFRENWVDAVLLSEMDFFPLNSTPQGMRIQSCPFHFGLKSRIAIQKSNEPIAEKISGYIKWAKLNGVIEELSKKFHLI